MTDYHEFRRQTIRRRRVRMVRRVSLLVLILALLAGGSFAVLRLTGLQLPMDSGTGSSSMQSAPESDVSSGAASGSVPAATPTAPPPAATNPPATADESTEWNSVHYTGTPTLNTTVQTQLDDGSTAMDYRLAGERGNTGRLDMSYFDRVVFLGDSLSHGLQIYETGVPNAQYCVYTGAGPQAVVNGQAVKRASDKVAEVIMDALVAKNPAYIYILFGTNVLTRDTSHASFLAYYGQMIDMIQAALPDAVIYIQSITPVRPNLRHSKPGLYRDRLMRVNDDLAALALSKGCYFVNIWEVLADENGDLKADIAQSDGYHLKPDGYTLWVEYLRTHAPYMPGVMYESGTSYYIER